MDSRLLREPRIQPSFAIERPEAMIGSGWVDFAWADVPVNDDGMITGAGVANIGRAVSQGEGMLKSRKWLDQAYTPVQSLAVMP